MDIARNEKVPRRILASLINSLVAGVVPRIGAPYIAIGREDEISALLSDLENVSEGGSSMRFIIGKYGSGKSFLMQLIRGFSLERGFLTADCDLSPERRICGSKGTGIATDRELMKNLSSKSSPDGGAIQSVIAKWLSNLQLEVAAEGLSPESAGFAERLSAKIFDVSRSLQSQIGGFDFAHVINTYYKAYLADDDTKMASCLRWIRGEYSTKAEAKSALGVSSIIDDDNWFDYLKLMAVFVQKIGYRGLIVFIDECVNLYKIPNRISRENNYEKLLSMFNDTLGGRSPGLGLVLGGTPQFLEDSRRGLFSYEALKSRLSDGRFANTAFKNLSGPVIKLRRLSDDELYALITRATKLHAQYYDWQVRITQDEMRAFFDTCLNRIGANSMITPREVLRDYLSLLDILRQNEEATFDKVMEGQLITLTPTQTESDEVNEKQYQSFTAEDIEI
ncbi:MAG: ATP-binding protein [Clostridia bacterium]|nr:ATP-binding protein [Clostridia bacterium]